MSRTSRRHFIKNFIKGTAALGLSPYFIDVLMRQCLGQAFAQSAPVLNTKNYIHISLAGGLPRWAFDLPLNPRNNSAEFTAGAFGTAIENTSTGVKNIYRVQRYNYGTNQSMFLPPVWFLSTAGRNFTQSLLPNCLFIRGIDMQINAHDVSNARQTTPNIGGLSINGALADVSDKPLPAVLSSLTSTSRTFKSDKGLAGLNMSVGSTNPLASLLAPFNAFGSFGRYTNSDVMSAFEQAYEKFDNHAISRGISSTTLMNSYDRAIALMASGVYQLNTQYPDMLNRYSELINAALTNRASMYTHLPQTISVNKTDKSFQTDNNINLNVSNLWDILKADSKPSFMAAQFAIVEFLINNNLSSSFTMGLPSWDNIYSSATAKTNVGHDHHNTGQFTETLLAMNYYRSLLVCLDEFKNRIANKWDDTIIHISSEWNRNPRADGIGSDHGVNGSNATLISGMIKGPYLIGNILKQDSLNPSLYPGTWGSAAKWLFANGERRELLVTDVAKTITSMLGVQDVTNNGYSLMKTNNGQIWSPIKVEAKNG